MSSVFAKVAFGLVLLGAVGLMEAGQVTVDVALEGATASKAWQLPSRGGASFRDGELVLDGLSKSGVWAFLREPAFGDFTLTCKVWVEPKGGGVRAYALKFHSPDSVSHHFIHVNRGAAILGWATRENGWNDLTRVSVKRPEGTWLDVRLECAGPQIRLYQDGKLLLSASDTHWTAGRVGFASSQGLVRVKDIKLVGTPAPLAKPWQEIIPPKRHGTLHELPPKHRHTDVSGKLDITVGEPFIISSRITRPEMGRHEQPHLFKLQNGDLLLVFHDDPDIHGAKRVCLRSRDKGRTWTPEPQRVNREEAVGALRDGTVLSYDCYSFLKGGDVYAKEMFVSRDGGATFEGPLLAMIKAPQLGNTLSSPVSATRKKFAARYKKTSAQWSSVGGPNFWRSVVELDDGALLACGHTRFKSGPKKLRSVCYRSTDKGRTWTALATIAYCPSMAGEGCVEPVMSLCSNGDVLCVMRTGGGLPLMQARSTDGGRTWQEATKTGSLGVDPDLCLMSNGVLACSYGRPGNRIMFSLDGTGREWSDRLKIYEYQGGSFGYTGIREVEPGKLLMVYDRHGAYPEYGGKSTTAIQAVYITVRRKE